MVPGWWIKIDDGWRLINGVVGVVEVEDEEYVRERIRQTASLWEERICVCVCWMRRLL